MATFQLRIKHMVLNQPVSGQRLARLIERNLARRLNGSGAPLSAAERNEERIADTVSGGLFETLNGSDGRNDDDR